jgi:hypothetical protein
VQGGAVAPIEDIDFSNAFSERERREFTNYQREQYIDMMKWIITNTPNVVAKMRLFTLNGFVKQIAKHPIEEIQAVLSDIERNYKEEPKKNLGYVFTQYVRKCNGSKHNSEETAYEF